MNSKRKLFHLMHNPSICSHIDLGDRDKEYQCIKCARKVITDSLGIKRFYYYHGYCYLTKIPTNFKKLRVNKKNTLDLSFDSFKEELK